MSTEVKAQNQLALASVKAIYDAADEANTLLDGMQQAATAAGTTLDGIYQDAEAAKTAADTSVTNLSQIQQVLEVARWIATHGTYVKATTFNPNATYYTVTATVVANPSDTDVDSSGVLIYYELTGGVYVRTADTSVDSQKTYYNVVGTPVASPDAEHISDYYTLSVTEAMSNYIQSHLVLTNDGLYVMADDSEWKVLITDDGMYIVDPNNQVIAEYNHEGLEVKTEEGTSIYKLSAGESSPIDASERIAFDSFSQTGTYHETFTRTLSGNSLYISSDFTVTVRYRNKTLTTTIGRADTSVHTITFNPADIEGDSATVTVQQTDTSARTFEVVMDYTVTAVSIGFNYRIYADVAYTFYGSNPTLRFGTQSNTESPAWSASFGENLIVSQPYSAHFGQYNEDKDRLLFSIGNGRFLQGRHNVFDIAGATTGLNYDYQATMNGSIQCSELFVNGAVHSALIHEDDTYWGGVDISYLTSNSIVGGRSGSINVAANSYKDATILFSDNSPWLDDRRLEPKVIASIYSTSTAGAIGSLSVSVIGLEINGNDDIIGFNVRVFNAGSANRAPAVDWIAITMPSSS